MFPLAVILVAVVSQASLDTAPASELPDEYPAYARGETIFIGESTQEIAGSCLVASGELVNGVGLGHPDAAQLQTLVEFWWQVVQAEVPDLAENTELPIASDYWLRWHYENDHAANVAWLMSIVDACETQEVAATHGGMPEFSPSPLIGIQAAPIERSIAACVAIAEMYEAIDHSNASVDRLAWWTDRAAEKNIADSALDEARERLHGDAAANAGLAATIRSSAWLNHCDDQQAVYVAHIASLDSDAPVAGQ